MTTGFVFLRFDRGSNDHDLKKASIHLITRDVGVISFARDPPPPPQSGNDQVIKHFSTSIFRSTFPDYKFCSIIPTSELLFRPPVPPSLSKLETLSGIELLQTNIGVQGMNKLYNMARQQNSQVVEESLHNANLRDNTVHQTSIQRNHQPPNFSPCTSLDSPEAPPATSNNHRTKAAGTTLSDCKSRTPPLSVLLSDCDSLSFFNLLFSSRGTFYGV
ncbi:unnamed protein product [Vicia faba]|uniref:Uncharacterized protein n=1 Tax=Vicia faba TaxID=3906 RepID=A0AAV1AM75_VICFA|nr:unnamed protein product [Vicia faba]